MTTQNLWGRIDVGTAPPSPVVILQKQASKLEEITGGLLSASVQRSQSRGDLVATLEVIAPYLYNYRLGVVEIRYPPGVYPMEVFDVVPERSHPDTGRVFIGSTTCENEEQFIQKLGDILGGPKLHKILASLMSHSQAERSGAQTSTVTSS